MNPLYFFRFVCDTLGLNAPRRRWLYERTAETIKRTTFGRIWNTLLTLTFAAAIFFEATRILRRMFP